MYIYILVQLPFSLFLSLQALRFSKQFDQAEAVRKEVRRIKNEIIQVKASAAAQGGARVNPRVNPEFGLTPTPGLTLGGTPNSGLGLPLEGGARTVVGATPNSGLGLTREGGAKVGFVDTPHSATRVAATPNVAAAAAAIVTDATAPAAATTTAAITTAAAATTTAATAAPTNTTTAAAAATAAATAAYAAAVSAAVSAPVSTSISACISAGSVTPTTPSKLTPRATPPTSDPRPGPGREGAAPRPGPGREAPSQARPPLSPAKPNSAGRQWTDKRNFNCTPPSKSVSNAQNRLETPTNRPETPKKNARTPNSTPGGGTPGGGTPGGGLASRGSRQDPMVVARILELGRLGVPVAEINATLCAEDMRASNNTAWGKCQADGRVVVRVLAQYGVAPQIEDDEKLVGFAKDYIARLQTCNI